MRIKLILLTLLLASCGVPLLTPYKMDINQGNFVSADMREKLKLGMTRQQVRYVLGTPLINDVFHGDRWDYVYRLERGGKLVEQQHLVIYFEGDKLLRIDDDPKPEQNVLAAVAPAIVAPVAVVPVVAPTLAEPAALPSAVKEFTSAEETPSVEVSSRVHDWAAAWSAQEVNEYLAFYAPGFDTGGLSRTGWEEQRTERISKPKFVEVELNDLAVSVTDANHATANFTQTYRSDHINDVMRKTMQLEKISGAWLIVTEQTAK